jgi:hypothetical protein
MLRRIFCVLTLAAFVVALSGCSSKSEAETRPEIYNMQAEVVDASNSISLSKLNVPDTIDGHKRSFAGIIDKSKIALILYSETIGIMEISSIGVYDLETNEYAHKLNFEENQVFGIHAMDEDHIIFRMSMDDWKTAGIFDFSFQDGELRKVYDYSINPETSAVVYHNFNNIALQDGTIWFDDYYLDDSGEIAVDVYEYDLANRELELVKKEAQNPLLYNGVIYLFVKNENNEFKNLQAIDGSQTIEMEVNLIEIAASTEGIYCLENKFTDHENRVTEFQVTDLTSNIPILSTTRSIGRLKVSSRFVTWSNFDDDIPQLYDASSKKLVAFSELVKGVNSFYVKDDYGFLVHTHDGIDDIYLFEPKR